MHSREAEAVRLGLLRRQVQLLEALCDECDADFEPLEQCGTCGQWFQAVGKHAPHCYSPEA